MGCVLVPMKGVPRQAELTMAVLDSFLAVYESIASKRSCLWRKVIISDGQDSRAFLEKIVAGNLARKDPTDTAAYHRPVHYLNILATLTSTVVVEAVRSQFQSVVSWRENESRTMS